MARAAWPSTCAASRAPPNPRRSPQTQPKPNASTCDPDALLMYEVDPDFLEYRRREDAEQLDLPFEL